MRSRNRVLSMCLCMLIMMMCVLVPYQSAQAVLPILGVMGAVALEDLIFSGLVTAGLCVVVTDPDVKMKARQAWMNSRELVNDFMTWCGESWNDVVNGVNVDNGSVMMSQQFYDYVQNIKSNSIAQLDKPQTYFVNGNLSIMSAGVYTVEIFNTRYMVPNRVYKLHYPLSVLSGTSFKSPVYNYFKVNGYVREMTYTDYIVDTFLQILYENGKYNLYVKSNTYPSISTWIVQDITTQYTNGIPIPFYREIDCNAGLTNPLDIPTVLYPWYAYTEDLNVDLSYIDAAANVAVDDVVAYDVNKVKDIINVNSEAGVQQAITGINEEPVTGEPSIDLTETNSKLQSIFDSIAGTGGVIGFLGNMWEWLQEFWNKILEKMQQALQPVQDGITGVKTAISTGVLSITQAIDNVRNEVQADDLTQKTKNFKLPDLFILILAVILACIRLLLRTIAYIGQLIAITPDGELLNDHVKSGIDFFKNQNIPYFNITYWYVVTMILTVLYGITVVKYIKRIMLNGA